MNIFYRIWCFFMDSGKGREKYHQECSDYNKKKNGVRFTTFITFAPYPGRFKWREWGILEEYRKYRNLIWKCYYKKIQPEISLNIVQFPIITKGVTLNDNDYSALESMAVPDSQIYWLHTNYSNREEE